MPDRETALRPATPDELEQTLAHALRFNGRRQFKLSGESMARITASHLAEALRLSGLVVTKQPPLAAHGDPRFSGSRAGEGLSRRARGRVRLPRFPVVT